MPILESFLDNKVLGREYKRGFREGELTILRIVIKERFGAIPSSIEEWLAARSTAELEELAVPVLRVERLEDLLLDSSRAPEVNLNLPEGRTSCE